MKKKIIACIQPGKSTKNVVHYGSYFKKKKYTILRKNMQSDLIRTCNIICILVYYQKRQCYHLEC